MLTLANQIFSLVSTILVGVVTALAVPNTIWKRRAICAIILIGLVQLLFLVLTWEESRNTAYVAQAIFALWAAIVWLAGTFALQSLLILALGCVAGWTLNESVRKHRGTFFLRPDRRVWKTGYSIRDFAGSELAASVNTAIATSNQKQAVFEESTAKKNIILAGLGPYAALVDDPDPELASAKRNEAAAKVEFNSAHAQASELQERSLNVVYSRLENRELLAQGFLPPFTHDSEARNIPADQWLFLRFDPSMQQAIGQGVTYIGVKVTEPKQRGRR